MKLSTVLSLSLLGSILSMCLADNCFDMDLLKAAHDKVLVECKDAIEKAGDAKPARFAAAVKCCLEKHGAINGDKVDFDKVKALGLTTVLDGKQSVVEGAYDACKDKFADVAGLMPAEECVCEKLKPQCDDIEKIKEKTNELMG